MKTFDFIWILKKPPTIKMCCDLKTHIAAIAVINLVFAGLGATHSIQNYYRERDNIFVNNLTNTFVSTFVYVSLVLVVILCLVGTIKEKRFLLIPFMVFQSIAVPIIIIICSLLMVGGLMDSRELIPRGGHIMSIIVLGVSLYLLVIVAIFYKKLASEMNYGQREGMVFESVRTTEVSKDYVP